MLGVTTDPEETQFTEDTRKQYYIERRNYYGNDRSSAIFLNGSADPYANEIDNMMIGYDFPTKYSPAQYNNANLQPPCEYYHPDQRVTVNSKHVNKFIVTRKDDYAEKRNYLEKKKRKAVLFNGSRDLNINQINYLINKNSFQTDSFTQYSDTDLKPNKYHDPNQRGTEVLGKQDLVERGYFSDDREEFYNDSIDPYKNKMKNIVKTEDKSTQCSNTNLKLEQNRNKTISQDVPSQNNRTCYVCKDKHTRLYTMPSYYAELIPKVNRSRTSSPLAYLHRKENSSFNSLNILQNGSCKYSKSQHFSSEHQMRHETLSDTNCVKEKQDDPIRNRTYFVNRQEARPFIIGQAQFAPSEDIQNKLEQRNKRQIMDNTNTEKKSEPKSSPKSQFEINEKQAVKYHNSSTAILKQTSIFSNSSQNVLKEYPDQNKKYEKTGRAYNEALNYTQYLIQKLSEKNSNRNILKEGRRNSQTILGKSLHGSEEKFTQTLRAAANKMKNRRHV